jgi:putative colanic acid biosynthesis acetyltransferase WcaF
LSSDKAREIDMGANRALANYTPAERVGRVLWAFGAVVFRLIPRPLYGLRSAWLRLFGARVGARCQIYPTVRIFAPWQLEIGDWSAVGDRAILYNLGSIRIGRDVAISQNAHICAGTHDHADPALPLIRSHIVVEDSVWICADAFVGPDLRVGEGAVVGARAVVTRDVPPWTIVAGNPARHIKTRELRS